ncbi:hypothetical protein LZ518_08475 [Sphingomonas sp. RB56-2]|uniref:Uncharacterized protein n=1 Tax=Sphingomonas brevis TaxID=2908206 RepID=A0ABT0SAJ4_9SPHN|nr:hypothetical protein [Sphingomonas brevis]MCL6741164.1 hypothetical protein [Sphingomonas brevis]
MPLIIALALAVAGEPVSATPATYENCLAIASGEVAARHPADPARDIAELVVDYCEDATRPAGSGTLSDEAAKISADADVADIVEVYRLLREVAHGVHAQDVDDTAAVIEKNWPRTPQGAAK